MTLRSDTRRVHPATPAEVSLHDNFEVACFASLTLATFPASYAEPHCPGNIASLRLRLVQGNRMNRPIRVLIPTVLLALLYISPSYPQSGSDKRLLKLQTDAERGVIEAEVELAHRFLEGDGVNKTPPWLYSGTNKRRGRAIAARKIGWASFTKVAPVFPWIQCMRHIGTNFRRLVDPPLPKLISDCFT